MLAFYILAIITIITALWTITSEHLVQSVVALFFFFLSMVGLYLSLHLEFLAFVQFFLFVGAISVLFLFAVMTMKEYAIEKSNPRGKFWLGGIFLGSLTFLPLFFFLQTLPFLTGEDSLVISLPSLGKALLNEFVLPFEVISLVLLAVLVGSITLMKKEN